MRIVAGMVGLTHPHSAGHLRTLDAVEAVGDVVLYDPDPAARASGLDVSRKARAVYADLPALLAHPGLSAVVVALPNNRMPGAIVECARAGKHIICEKPCARSAAELRPALDALAHHRVGFTVCYVWRAHPAVERMRELVRTGAVGRITSAELRMVTTQVRFRDPGHWLFSREVAGGGVVSWLGCHWLDALRYVSGDEVAAVSATVGTLSGAPIDVEDVASVNLRLAGGALVNLYAGYVLPFGPAGYEGAAFDLSMIFRGTTGTLRYQRLGDEHLVTLRSAAPGSSTPSEQVDRYVLPPIPAYGGAPGLRFVETFLRNAHDGGGGFASAADALRVLQILDAVYASARTGAGEVAVASD